MFCLPCFTQVFHPWWCETCRVIQQQFWMKEAGIFRWIKTYSNPSCIFSGGQDPPTPGSTPRSLTETISDDCWRRFYRQHTDASSALEALRRCTIYIYVLLTYLLGPATFAVHITCEVFCADCAPCGLRGCKNGLAPFPGRMSYKATKPGLVSALYLSMFFIVLVFIRAPFYVFLVFIVCVLSFGCSSCHYLPSDWQERPLWAVSHLPYSSWR